MSRYVPILLALAALTALPQTAEAHIGGLPYFKINDQYTATYQIPSISVPELRLPQDSAPENYAVNTPLQLLLDTNILQIPAGIVAQTHFEWDFGDGSRGEGVANTHAYAKPGSYLITITGSTPQAVAPALIESTVVHIIPQAGYQLPVPAITVNGRTVIDPTVEAYTYPPGTLITFDASASAVSAGPATYSWNFGDGSTIAHGAVVQHSYTKKNPLAITMVRVQDANNLFSDSYITIKNIPDGAAPRPNLGPSKPSSAVNGKGRLLLISAEVVSMLGIGVVWLRRKHS